MRVNTERTMAAIIPDPTRLWVKGTEYITCGDEYTSDGTCVGVGTVEYITHGRACGCCYASPIKLPEPKVPDLGELFLEMFG
jgi:hypothetical protein